MANLCQIFIQSALLIHKALFYKIFITHKSNALKKEYLQVFTFKAIICIYYINFVHFLLFYQLYVLLLLQLSSQNKNKNSFIHM